MSTETDRGFLRRFEPVVRYTRGEAFFPIDVEPYVRASSLWLQLPGEDPECLVPEGELTLEKLAHPRAVLSTFSSSSNPSTLPSWPPTVFNASHRVC